MGMMNRIVFKPLFLCMICTLMIVIAAIGLSACATGVSRALDPKLCMETVPFRVDGLKITAGPRPRQSIIGDMVPVVCNSRVLFMRMQGFVGDIDLAGHRGLHGQAGKPDGFAAVDHVVLKTWLALC